MTQAVLLDTHAFVWAASAPDRLGNRAKQELLDPSVDVGVSAVSALEIATKVRLGKFPEAEPFVDGYPAIVDRLGATHLPIGHGHALRAGSLNWDHRDPFDRLLAAQALLENRSLVTRDRAFGQLGGLHVIW